MANVESGLREHARDGSQRLALNDRHSLEATASYPVDHRVISRATQ